MSSGSQEFRPLGFLTAAKKVKSKGILILLGPTLTNDCCDPAVVACTLNMEVFGAISLIGNILPFLEHGIIIVIKASQILKSADGKLEEDLELRDFVKDVESLHNRIRFPKVSDGAESESDGTLNRLIEKCAAVAHDIKDIQEACEIRLKDPKKKKEKKPGFLQALGSAVKTAAKQSELKELRERVIDLRDQVSAQLIILIR